jgi:esterase/lipase superfamily enzyme
MCRRGASVCSIRLVFLEEFILFFEHVFQHLVSPMMTAHHLRSRSATRHNLEDATTFLRAPVLFMTATATPLILEQLRRITGLTMAIRCQNDEENNMNSRHLHNARHGGLQGGSRSDIQSSSG